MFLNEPLPAAAYFRVSTNRQLYSIEHQKTAVKEYAAKNGFTIVRTYQDIGKSGLTVKKRKAFSSLLKDVAAGDLPYQAILVHDVPRWGRFQDIDESAYHEFVCRQAGIPVHYCGEAFASRGNPWDMVLKSMQRAMAAEYSRELSVKCFRGQKRIAELGFSVGGSAPYGFRRLSISSDGSRKRELQGGQHKSAGRDRVTLVLGPPSEVECVKGIFDMVLHGRRTPNAIANDLNRRKVRSPRGNGWSSSSIYQILTNPKYMGCSVWNRRSWKLQGPMVKHPPPIWVSRPNAFAPIIQPSKFAQVQEALATIKARFTDESLLRDLRSLLASHRKLTGKLIDRTPQMARSETYSGRFGSLLGAYAKIGYRP
jgi:DNA invertase Pin-like site-specific DNA recombinase